jgi:hypothetical protein
MCEPHLLGIRNERVGKLAVSQDPVSILRNPAPGSEMNFIDAYRRVTVSRRPRAASVRPAGQAMDNGGRPRRPLGREGIRVCLEQDAAVARLDFHDV